MTWGLTAQRRADEFDALVSGSGAAVLDDRSGRRDAGLLELVGALRAVPVPEARAEFVNDLRARLMAEAETALVPDDLTRLRLPVRQGRRDRRLAVLVGGLAIAGATTSVAVAAQSALPGESLYPVKRVLESAHTGLSVGDAGKGRTELANASIRLDEASALVRDPGLGDDERVESTLATFSQQASAGADLLLEDYASTGHRSSIVTLHDFAAASLDRLEKIEPLVPFAARDELIAAAATLAQMDARAAQSCPSCGGAPLGTLPQTLLAAESTAATLPPATLTPARGTVVHRRHRDHADGSTPSLPTVDGTVTPGSVVVPGTGDATATPDPLRALTDGLTGTVDGTDTEPGTGATTKDPVSTATDGVGTVLDGVVDPVTGLAPTPTALP